MRTFPSGLSIFFIGLFKKAVLADGVAPYGSSVFDAAAAGETLSFFVAWGGALAYTMQLYFDFSGYSDMAIGAARLFGIRLPLNFHSPYKATSIIEFWRRWHMTLSRFLRDYLYIPLGGSRHGKARRYFNLMATMLLGGLWHGAGWTFVAWGGLHGLYLVVNHAWHWFRQIFGYAGTESSRTGKLVAWLITFMAVVAGWVFFRATDFHSAIAILEGMAGMNGVALPNAVVARLGDAGMWLQSAGVGVYLGGGSDFFFTWLWTMALLAVVLMMPNTQQIMSFFEPALRVYQSDDKYEIRFGERLVSRITWQPTEGWASGNRPGGGAGPAGSYQHFRISLFPVLMTESKQRYRSYLQLWLAVVVTFLCLMAALNYLVDPYGMFDTIRIQGVNAVNRLPAPMSGWPNPIR